MTRRLKLMTTQEIAETARQKLPLKICLGHGTYGHLY